MAKTAVPINPKRALALVGPTSSGKSRLAIQISQVFPCEVICMDSMQIYRELAIGTARPSNQDLKEVPHHLYGFRSVREPMSAAAYAEMAQRKIETVLDRDKLPILVGGTGLYLRALVEGLSDLPSTPKTLRQRLDGLNEKKGLGHLYALLARLDPAGARQLHPNDRQRIQRFLEVRILTGKSMLDHWKQQKLRPKNPTMLCLGLSVERQVLNTRIQKQTAEMLHSGWIEETRGLIEQNLMPDVLRLGPIGYREIGEFLSGKLEKEALWEKIFIATRQYAKRQMTWFRKGSYIQWFHFDPDLGYNIPLITNFIKGNIG